jgi:hypothetical protein
VLVAAVLVVEVVARVLVERGQHSIVIVGTRVVADACRHIVAS